MFDVSKLDEVTSESEEIKDINYNLDGLMGSELDFINGEIVTVKVKKQQSVKKLQAEYDAKLLALNSMDCINCLHHVTSINFCNHYEIDIYDTTIQALNCDDFFNITGYINT